LTAIRHRLRMVLTGALIILLAIASAARAQTPNVPSFERRVEADRNALKIPGLSIIVLQDGEVLSARGFGYADVEHRIPATPDTL
jgi:CubicO group peptidase (beta-lactamase class C family)